MLMIAPDPRAIISRPTSTHANVTLVRLSDIATLNAWIADGRLLPEQTLEQEGTGMRLQAGQLPGLNFTIPSPNLPPPNFGAGQTYQQYYARPGGAPLCKCFSAKITVGAGGG